MDVPKKHWPWGENLDSPFLSSKGISFSRIFRISDTGIIGIPRPCYTMLTPWSKRNAGHFVKCSITACCLPCSLCHLRLMYFIWILLHCHVPPPIPLDCNVVGVDNALKHLYFCLWPRLRNTHLHPLRRSLILESGVRVTLSQKGIQSWRICSAGTVTAVGGTGGWAGSSSKSRSSSGRPDWTSLRCRGGRFLGIGHAKSCGCNSSRSADAISKIVLQSNIFSRFFQAMFFTDSTISHVPLPRSVTIASMISCP